MTNIQSWGEDVARRAKVAAAEQAEKLLAEIPALEGWKSLFDLVVKEFELGYMQGWAGCLEEEQKARVLVTNAPVELELPERLVPPPMETRRIKVRLQPAPRRVETKRTKPRPVVPPVHGQTCVKARHDLEQTYLHEAMDDRPYEVDGLLYCGRCHYFLRKA